MSFVKIQSFPLWLVLGRGKKLFTEGVKNFSKNSHLIVTSLWNSKEQRRKVKVENTFVTFPIDSGNSINHHFSSKRRGKWEKWPPITVRNVHFSKNILNCKRGAMTKKSWNEMNFILRKYFDHIPWFGNVVILLLYSTLIVRRHSKYQRKYFYEIDNVVLENWSWLFILFVLFMERYVSKYDFWCLVFRADFFAKVFYPLLKVFYPLSPPYL